MRKIIVGAMVSMDGVMQAPGGASEDPTKGFRFGGWARVSANGLMVGHYEREGEVRIADAAPDAPSEREIARRKRMNREG